MPPSPSAAWSRARSMSASSPPGASTAMLPTALDAPAAPLRHWVGARCARERRAMRRRPSPGVLAGRHRRGRRTALRPCCPSPHQREAPPISCVRFRGPSWTLLGLVAPLSCAGAIFRHRHRSLALPYKLRFCFQLPEAVSPFTSSLPSRNVHLHSLWPGQLQELRFCYHHHLFLPISFLL